jgi:hypothetical protein
VPLSNAKVNYPINWLIIDDKLTSGRLSSESNEASGVLRMKGAVQRQLVFLGKRADYYNAIAGALRDHGLGVAIATTADAAVALCLTNQVLLVLIDCEESWPSDCWHPARAIKAIAPRVPIIALASAQHTLEFVDEYCTLSLDLVQTKVMQMVSGR